MPSLSFLGQVSICAVTHRVLLNKMRERGDVFAQNMLACLMRCSGRERDTHVHVAVTSFVVSVESPPSRRSRSRHAHRRRLVCHESRACTHAMMSATNPAEPRHVTAKVAVRLHKAFRRPSSRRSSETIIALPAICGATSSLSWSSFMCRAPCAVGGGSSRSASVPRMAAHSSSEDIPLATEAARHDEASQAVPATTSSAAVATASVRWRVLF